MFKNLPFSRGTGEGESGNGGHQDEKKDKNMERKSHSFEDSIADLFDDTENTPLRNGSHHHPATTPTMSSPQESWSLHSIWDVSSHSAYSVQQQHDYSGLSRTALQQAALKRDLHGSSRLLENRRKLEEAAASRRSGVSTTTTPRLSVAIASASRASSNASSLEESIRLLRHTRQTFLLDALNMAEGTIPQSVVLAFVIGTCCGVVAFVYYTVLDFMLDFLWHTLPEWIVIDKWPVEYYACWIPLLGTIMALGVGLSVKFLGEPGDLAFTILCVHEKAYIPMDHVTPMFFTSLCSILGGGSLGPEAPLVAICASLGGFISRKVFGQKCRNVVRKHTLMGMAGALAAFFGVPLGGSIFALEVCSRFGIEYFEHLVEAIFCGEVCLVVFRTLSGLKIEPIWEISPTKIGPMDPWMVFVGGFIGLLGAGTATLFFAPIHSNLMKLFARVGLLDNELAVWRALLGAVGVLGIGVLVPHTMFWGEREFQTIATMAPSSKLPEVWPTSGAIGFEMNSVWSALVVGCLKMLAISFTVLGGYRGGFIFPFFAAGAAFGNVVGYVFPWIPIQICVLGFAAGINVAITRTALATTLILCYLSAEQNAISVILAASLCSLLATSYMPFIKTQIVRSDIDHSLFYRKKREPQVMDSIADFDPVDGEEICE